MVSEGIAGPRLLHICADFAKQRIYTQLVAHLAKEKVSQIVYAAVRTRGESQWTSEDLAGIDCHLRHVLRPHHKLMFRTKVSAVLDDLGSCVNLPHIQVAHAHFLYSDGAVALGLKQRFGIPYVVAVRNTDLNMFMRYRPDLGSVRDRILDGASRVIFLTNAYRRRLIERLPTRLRDRVEAKSVVVPNGVHADWLRSESLSVAPQQNALRLLYVGDFSRNKNIPGLLQAAALLGERRAVSLTLVGGGGDDAQQVQQLLQSGSYPFARNIGRVTDPEQLRHIYRQHDVFVMVSFFETFGVVYIEALSQGLPIVHSQGQGVDGYFAGGGVAEAVDPRDPVDIAEKIHNIAARLPGIRTDCIRQAQQFNWTEIARSYSQLYRAIVAEIGRAS